MKQIGKYILFYIRYIPVDTEVVKPFKRISSTKYLFRIEVLSYYN